MVLSIPLVQTKLAEIVTQKVNDKYNTDISIKKVDLSFLGSVQLKGVKLKDHHKDTLIFVKYIKTSLLTANRIINNNVNLGDISLNGVDFFLKTHKNEQEDNLSVFIKSVEGDSVNDSINNPFVLKTKNIYLSNVNFKLIDANKKDSLSFLAKNIGGSIQDLLIDGSDVKMKIRGLYFTDDRDIKITKLSTDFSYSKKQMLFDNSEIKTKSNSFIRASMSFNYKIEDLKDFVEKVNIKANFKNSRISISDLKKFYSELSGNDMLYFKTRFNGTLNNFGLSRLVVSSKEGLRIRGNLEFINPLNTKEGGFVFDADIKSASSNYNQLKKVLPNVLGKNIPSDFRKLGNFTISGQMSMTSERMSAMLNINSETGKAKSNLQLSNIDDIDHAKYSGKVFFEDFNFGEFLNDSNFGKVSLEADVTGKGFSSENIKTSIIGEISKMNFRGYDYKDISVNGQFENKRFNGKLIAKDKNFNMNFKGLADFSSEVYDFDFKADIAKIDLKKTKLFTRDSIAELSGKVVLDVKGNSFDNVVGKVIFENLNYTNQKRKYPFKKFEINSQIKDSIKTIKVDSKEIIEGELTGKFNFKELLLMAQNSLGSIYTYYEPNVVAKNQFANFSFMVHNQIIDIFFPKVNIDKKTSISGKVRSSDNYLKINFSSPKITAYENKITNLILRLDNKNKLYNTHLTADKVETKLYNFSNFNLINKTVNDTLFFKSAFKGGEKETEDYNIDFFYTINADKKSVVGLQKSKILFKDNQWQINPKNNKKNLIVFSLSENEFSFDDFLLKYNNQQINFKGGIYGKTNKTFELALKDVKLQSFLPETEGLNFKGVLNGKVNYNQSHNESSPAANIEIKNLTINNSYQGTLTLNSEKNSYSKKQNVKLLLKNNKNVNLSAVGNIDFSQKKPIADLTFTINNYQLKPFKDVGGEVITNLRGNISGGFTAKGHLINPDFKGYLNLKNAGLGFPDLNVDFDIEENSKVTLKKQSFEFNKTVLKDTEFNTKGVLTGKITHQNFEKWFLDLALKTNDLVVLNTKETEETPYYGTAFLKGDARITGRTSNLTIDVNGSTNPKTIFVIPLKDVTTVNNYKLVHFKNKEENKKTKNVELEDIKGLNLNFNLEITKDAVAQVVIDKTSGSDLKGSGTGNLNIEINTSGKFNMFGDFIVDSGVYNFKYGGIISRPFKVQKGGNISWTGNPLKAELNLVAIYQTKANPRRLLENIVMNRKIPVDLYTEISGGMFDSKQQFDIKIPNIGAVVSSELEFKINDNDQNGKMRQFFSLLVTGSFFNEEDLGVNASSFGSNTASDLVSGILSDLINTKDGKFQLGVDYTQGNKNKLTNINSDNQVDVTLSTKLSDRVLVNGKLGVPIGGETQTSVIGELNLEILLNEKGNLRGAIFNKQNEIQYTQEDEGYTQGIGLSYQVNFNNFSELLQETGLKKKKKDIRTKADSIKINKKLINFKQK